MGQGRTVDSVESGTNGINEDSTFVTHSPCPECGSRDNLAVYSDGHGYCFGCGYYKSADNTTVIKKETKKVTDLICEKEFKYLTKRKIDEETCRKFGYSYGNFAGSRVQIASYLDSTGKEIAQKVRFANKDFRVLGNGRDLPLWGMHLWNPKMGSGKSKRLVVTEGEVDCMTVSQIFGNKWPVVSVPNGAKGAAKSIANNIEWVESFETVIFCFDQDDAGREAAKACADIIEPGKAQIVMYLPAKDANQCLIDGTANKLSECIWNAQVHRPDGIVCGEDLWPMLSETKEEESIPYPWPSLNNKLHGIRAGELVTLCSGTGIGKSSVCRELAYWLLQNGANIGYIALEESKIKTARSLMGIHMNIPLQDWKERGVSIEQQKAAYENSIGKPNRFTLIDHWGSTSEDWLLKKVRQLIKARDCNVIFLDHISIVVSAMSEGDERRNIDAIMTKLRGIVEECKIAMFLVSHLKRPEGRGHEDGARTSMSQLRGSAAIGQLSDAVCGLERDQQSIEEGNVLNVRVLKNRYTGETGLATVLEYERTTGRLHERMQDEVVNESEVPAEDF